MSTMNISIRFTAICIAVLLIFPALLNACSCFLIENDGNVVVGRNFDWFSGDAVVLVNKHGVTKYALVMPPDTPANWQSRYGSITVNQIGRDWPMEGINEAGLFVANLWLSETVYPEPDQRPAVSDLQWIQYQLDVNKSVDEVISSDSVIRIAKTSTPLHFFVADAEGNAAVIEFIDGRQVVHAGKDMPYRTITNSTYDNSLQFLQEQDIFGGDSAFVQSSRSRNRFVEVASRIEEYSKQDSEPITDYATGILDSVKIPKQDGWSCMYDITGKTMSFKSVESPEIRTVDITSFHFDCSFPVQYIDLETDKVGDVTSLFKDYTVDMNIKQAFECFKIYSENGVAENTPESVIEAIARQPFGFECVSGGEK